MSQQISRGDIKLTGFNSREMEFQLIRQLGATMHRAASIGECLALKSRMTEETPYQWVEEFERLANWQKEDGLERLKKDHVVSGREQLWRACNSFRAAEYYSPSGTDEHRRFGILSADCFSIAMSAMNLHFESHLLPYGDINLPVYFISPENDGRKRKTVMIVSGFDGTLEEEFQMRGLAALERGYNVIHFAGPGQMDVSRRYPDTFFEPNFEDVLKHVIYHFEHRHEIDMNHLYLMGISFGGYFALRAAVYEPRLAGLILNSPIVDLHQYLLAFVGDDPANIPDDQDFTLDDLSSIPADEMSDEQKTASAALMYRFGRKSFKQTFEYLKSFKVDDDLISELKVPCLALVGEGEGEEPKRQFKEFIQITECSTYEFNMFEGASMHCQVGNIVYANAVVYDWLDNL